MFRNLDGAFGNLNGVFGNLNGMLGGINVLEEWEGGARPLPYRPILGGRHLFILC